MPGGPDTWTRPAIRQAVDDLRDGVPPQPEIATWLTVGQDRIVHQLELALERAANGETVVRFLRGDPGFGKSHFLNLLRHRGGSRNALISYSSQDLAAGITFNHPQSVYRQIVADLDESAANGGDVLERVLKRWARDAIPLVANARPTLAMLRRLSEVGLLPPYDNVSRRCRLELTAYLLATVKNNPEVVRTMVNAIRGQQLSNNELCGAAIGVGWEPWYVGYTPTKYDDAFWFGQLGLLSHLARSTDWSATAVLLDELESLIELQSSRSRDKGYRVLNGLFRGEYSLGGILMVFAYTPEFLRRVHRDFEAYGHEFRESWLRIVEDNSFNLDELDEGNVSALLDRLSLLHGAAENWNAADAANSSRLQLLRDWRKNGRSTRFFVRSAISALDRASQRL